MQLVRSKKKQRNKHLKPEKFPKGQIMEKKRIVYFGKKSVDCQVRMIEGRRKNAFFLPTAPGQ